LIDRIETMQGLKFIHRDIKPENFLIGLPSEAGLIYLIDFGLSKQFVSSNGQHIPYKEKKSLVGTARYASINTHKGIE